MESYLILMRKTALFILAAGCLIGIFTSMTSALWGVWGAALSLGLAGLIFAAIIVWRFPYWVLIFLIVFTVAEALILKFIPGPEQLYAAAQLTGEALVYLMFGATLIKTFLSHKPFRKTFTDIPLAAFLLGAAVSIAINQAPPTASLLNIRSAIRYIALFYSVVNLSLSQRQVSQLIKTILAMGAAEILIGVVQLAGGARLYSFFAPRQSEGIRTFATLTQGRELGSVFGSLGDTVYFGLFMLVILALYLSPIKKINLRTLSAIAVIVVAIGFSYSRASFLLAILMIIVWYVQFYKVRIIHALVAGAAFLAVFALIALGNGVKTNDQEYINPRFQRQTILQNITNSFTKQYVANAQKNRLGELIWVPPVVARNAFWFGYGPDQTTTVNQLNKTDISNHYDLRNGSGFEDVYWVAIFAYYGIAGALAFIVLFATGVASAWNIAHRTESALTREIATATYCLWAITPILLFFNRALEFRAFSFFLWLLPALMINLFARERRTLRIKSVKEPGRLSPEHLRVSGKNG
ncbi:MAG: hypothetical protein HKUEN02_13600 [Anaerolineaceae bacterium]|nr:MAG: hypothetical protein HKUEN02_13600 [Anaerolineaceae bacterium]